MVTPHQYQNAVFLTKYAKERRINPGESIDLPTHTSYQNGSYVVTVHERKNFLQKYFKEFNLNLKSGKPTLFLTERCTNEYFKFFVDIDFPWDDQCATKERKLEIVKHISNAVVEVLNYIKDDITEYDDLIVRPSSRTNHKIHITFPQVMMRADTCMLFASAVNELVNSNCTSYKIPMDLQPYKNGSLRLIGSYNKTIVPTCAQETSLYYMPFDIHTGDDLQLTYELLEEISLLPTESVLKQFVGFATADDDDIELKTDKDVFFVPGKYKPTAEQAARWLPNGNGKCIGTSSVVMPSIPVKSPLFEFLNNKYGPEFPYSAHDVQYNELCESLFISFKTHKCLLAGREHKKNHPYMTINRHGCRMKCHSTHDSCLKKVYNHIAFNDLDDDVKSLFWSACLMHFQRYVPEKLWNDVVTACENILSHYNYTNPESSELKFIESFTTKRANSIIKICEHPESNVLKITDKGMFHSCTSCHKQYPDGNKGMHTSDFDKMTSGFFSLVESYKKKGREAFIAFGDALESADSLNCITTPITRYVGNFEDLTLSERANILGKEYKADGLKIFENDDVMNDAFIISLCGTDKDVATFVNMFISDQYVAAGIGEDAWYTFRAPRWRNNEAHNQLFNKVSQTTHYYEKACSYYQNSDIDKKIVEKRVKNIRSVRHKIGDVVFTKRVITRLSHMRLDTSFENKLDHNRHLICFSDGVYDLETYQFRQGKPEDYLSMSVGYNFPQDIDVDIRSKIETLLTQIQPDPESLMYLKKFMSSCIDGATSLELFHVFSGDGRNGKSLIADILSASLGCPEISDGTDLGKDTYINTYEPAFLTKERRGSSEAAPEVIDYRKARALIGSEPADEKINTSWLKKLTGNDTVSARALNSNVIIRYKPHFKLILVCNGLPKLSSVDKAVWRRSRIIDFPVEFKDDPDPDNPFEQKIDRNLKKELVQNPLWKMTFMAMLIEWHRDYLTPDGLIPPAAVLRATQTCKEESNPFLEWWNTRTTSAETHISSQRLRDDYIRWSGEPNKMSTNLFNKHLKKLTPVQKAVRTIEDGTQVGVFNRMLIKDIDMNVC